MKKIFYNICILLVTILFYSCEKDHLFDCLKSTGSIITESRTVADFSRIDVYNNVNVILTQDTENSIEVEAGSHIISGITTEISDGTLTIRNENKCNWVRSYTSTMAVHVHIKKLDMIQHYGSATISSTNQLQNTTFDLNVWSSGDINLSVEAQNTYARQHIAVGDITLSGHSDYAFIYNNGNGFSRDSNFQVDHGTVIQRATGDCYVNFTQAMDVEIHETGNVYYTGNPQITSSISGSGRLYHQ